MHNEEEVAFTMRADRQHKTPLTRQVEEAVSIEVRKVDYLLNSKSEFHGSRIPRIRIEVDNKIIEEGTKESTRKLIGSEKTTGVTVRPEVAFCSRRHLRYC